MADSRLHISAYRANKLRITEEGIYAEFWQEGEGKGGKTKLLLMDGELKTESYGDYHSMDNPLHPSKNLLSQYAYHTQKFIDGLAEHIHAKPDLGKTAIHDLLTHLTKWQERRNPSPDLSPIIDQIRGGGMRGGNFVHGTAAMLENTDMPDRQTFIDENYPVSKWVRKGSELRGSIKRPDRPRGIDNDPLNESAGRG